MIYLDMDPWFVFLFLNCFAQADKESGCFMESISKLGVNISDECMFV